MKKSLLVLLISCIDVEKLALGLIEGIGEEELKKLVAKTATPVDDAILPVVLSVLNPVIEELIKTNAAKLKSLVEGLA
jgi:hypothetical protein